jgi:hypothetical protein
LEKLAEQYSSRIDFGLHKAIFFPTQVHQHLVPACVLHSRAEALQLGLWPDESIHAHGRTLCPCHR